MRTRPITGINSLTALSSLIRSERNRLLEITKKVAQKTISRMPKRVASSLKGRKARKVSQSGKTHRRDFRSVSRAFKKRSE